MAQDSRVSKLPPCLVTDPRWCRTIGPLSFCAFLQEVTLRQRGFQTRVQNLPFRLPAEEAAPYLRESVERLKAGSTGIEPERRPGL